MKTTKEIVDFLIHSKVGFSVEFDNIQMPEMVVINDDVETKFLKTLADIGFEIESHRLFWSPKGL